MQGVNADNDIDTHYVTWRKGKDLGVWLIDTFGSWMIHQIELILKIIIK